MPPKWACLGIVCFWLATSALLFNRDLAPRLFQEGLNYGAVYSDRAVEESSRWVIWAEGRRLGTITGNTRPNADGGITLQTRVRLTSNLISGSENDNAPKIIVDGEFEIGPEKRLLRFQLSGVLDRPPIEAGLRGRLVGRELYLKSSGLPMFPTETRVEFDPQQLLTHALGPMDRLPDLWIGRQWTTYVVNPAAILLPGNELLHGNLPLEPVHHQVRREEIVAWGGRNWKCFVVEHRQNNSMANTWVRQSDGRVLRQDVPIGFTTLTLELDPSIDRWEGRGGN